MVWIGLPLAARRGRRLPRGSRELERRQANRLLDAHIPPLPAAGRTTTATLWRRALDALTDRDTVAHARARGDQAAAASPGCASSRSCPVALLAGLLSPRRTGDRPPGRPRLRRPVDARARSPACCCCALALAAGGARRSPRSTRCARCSRTLSRALLASRAAPEGPVREMLAESLGDRSLAIAYWLPDRGPSSTRRATRSRCPSPARAARGPRSSATAAASRRSSTTPSWTPAPSSSTPPPPASSLAIDNERLKADLRARVEELRVSRVRIVEAADDARRRIERDLHDGAQQQLASLVARPAAAEGVELNDNEAGAATSTSSPRSSPPRSPSCASSPAASTPRSSPSAAWCPPSPRSPQRAPVPGRGRHRDRRAPDAGGRGRRLLRRRRGADQRRQATPRPTTRASTCGATATT